MTNRRQRWYYLVVVLLAVALAVSGVTTQMARKSEKEKALIYQLQELRQAVQIYVQVNKQKPSSLAMALDAQYNFGHPFQWKFKRDALGTPVDSFGNPFQYDPDTGWVRSATAKYGEW